MNTARTLLCIALVIIKLNKSVNAGPTPDTSLSFKAFYLKGLRVTINVEGYSKFIFFDGVHYPSYERAINSDKPFGQIWGVAAEVKHNQWVFEDHNVSLKVGHSIRYALFMTEFEPVGKNEDEEVSIKYYGAVTGFRIFNVTELEARPPGENCFKSRTQVRGREVCSGQVIFEDNFNTIREDLWQIENYVPIDHPEHPFVSYQMLPANRNIYAVDGKLHIVPKLQEDLLRAKNESILTGVLDLYNSCTRKSCYKNAIGAHILPPIVSGRMTSASFSFKYGTVYVVAKLPIGDWIYPEILLEPLLKKYGGMKDLSRILKIAMAGGNRDISDPNYGNLYLKGRPIIDENCTPHTVYHPTSKRNTFWGDDFHEYVLRWTPDEIVLLVDRSPYFRYAKSDMETTFRCLADLRPDFDPNTFYDYLQITLGVAVGGVVEFSDTLTTANGKSKPWRNGSCKASYNFWQDRASWYPTWTRPSLIVDHIKVVAL